MSDSIESLFNQEPEEWVAALPEFQRRSVVPLLKGGRTHEEVAELWLSASAANTFKMGATPQMRAKDSFLEHVKKEVRAFLCGDPKYETERSGLFGEKAPTRAFVVSSIAVAIAPTLGVAAPFLSPIVALVIAGLGKIVLNAWCAAAAVEDSAEAS